MVGAGSCTEPSATTYCAVNLFLVAILCYACLLFFACGDAASNTRTVSVKEVPMTASSAPPDPRPARFASMYPVVGRAQFVETIAMTYFNLRLRPPSMLDNLMGMFGGGAPK